MQQRSVFLPVLCVTLFWLVRSLGAALALLDPELMTTIRGLAVHHFLWVILIAPATAWVLSRIKSDGVPAEDVGKGVVSLRTLVKPLPLVLLLLGLVTAAGHFSWLHPDSPHIPFAVPVISGSLLWPSILVVFFAQTPPGRWGMALGLGIALGDLIWVVALPLLHTYSQTPSPAVVTHVRTLIVLTYAAIGAALAAAVAGVPNILARVFDTFSPTENASFQGCGWRKSLTVLFGVFGVVALYYFLFGFGLVNEFPKLNRYHSFPSPLYYLLPAGLIGMGRLLDMGLRGFCVMGAIAVSASLGVILVVMARGSGPAEEAMPFFMMVREAMLIFALVCTARVAGRARQALKGLLFMGFVGLAYSLYLFSMIGAGLGRLFAGGTGLGQLMVSVGVAMAFIACMIVLLRNLARFPGVETIETGGQQFVPLPVSGGNDTEKPREHAVSPEEILKRTAFSEAFALTKREMDVLEGLLRHGDMNILREDMRISGHTVKYHLRGLLQKTNMTNRRQLINFYTLWVNK